MTRAARLHHKSDAAWARAAGVPKETLSRARSRGTADSRTLAALAASARVRLAALPNSHVSRAGSRIHLPDNFSREYAQQLAHLAASGNTDPEMWLMHGPGYFMAGVATLLASHQAFDRRSYLDLAESLHPGMTVPEVFECWLQRTPLRAARFMPMVRASRTAAPR